MPVIYSAQVALVKSAKAVIYSDIDLKSAIGFVRKGKQLAVGEVKRRRGEILPVIVNGRIAWIRVEDISLPGEEKSFDKSRKVTEHEIVVEDKTKDPLGQNNFITLQSGPSAIKFSTSGADDSTDLSTATETSLMFNHKNPYRMIHWGFGFDFFQGEFDFLQFRSINLKGGVSWVPIRFGIFSLETYANILMSGDFRAKSRGIGEYKGNMYGAEGGVMVRLFPEYLFGLVAGFGLTEYRFSGLSSIESDADDSQAFEVKSFSGSKIFIGLSYRFN